CGPPARDGDHRRRRRLPRREHRLCGPAGPGRCAHRSHGHRGRAARRADVHRHHPRAALGARGGRVAAPPSGGGAVVTPRVVVVGAGFGGIAAGVKMLRAGITTFTIYESSLGIGGTWWDNTYPGAEVDVGSHLYCFSFKPHAWTRTHAKQPELQKYLEETVDEFGLRPHLQLGVAVESATWDDHRHVWTVQLDDGRVDECHVLISG